MAFARAKSCTSAQALYKLAQLYGITPLSGTTNEEHMKEDVAVEKIAVGAEDEKVIKNVAEWMEIAGISQN